MSTTPYIGRLAPSPTGLLHLGHAATFLIAHDRARAAGGRLLLRVDDLDPQRSREHFLESAKSDLAWLGITCEEEFRQSQRLTLYRNAMRALLEAGFAYPCSCSRKDLQRAVEAPHEDGDDEPVYSGRCRPGLERVSRELRPETNYRFRVPDRETVHLTDEHFGPQNFTTGCSPAAAIGDFLVWRKDGVPSYQLACVVDDAAMGISEVVRGRDLLKSTARQILLQRALQLPSPVYFHTDLLRDQHGARLAKRHDALSLRSLRDKGVTPAELRGQIAAGAHQSYCEVLHEHDAAHIRRRSDGPAADDRM